MDIQKYWPEIKTLFNTSFKTNFHVSLATVSQDSVPDISPIGSFFLNNDQTGFYFEKYPTTIGKHAEHNKTVCILGVNSGFWFWLKSLYSVEFKSSPGIKLYGILGEKRKASEKEIARLNRRMKSSKNLKGNSYLWGEMRYVRDIQFFDAKSIELGKMTKHLNFDL